MGEEGGGGCAVDDLRRQNPHPAPGATELRRRLGLGYPCVTGSGKSELIVTSSSLRSLLCGMDGDGDGESSDGEEGGWDEDRCAEGAARYEEAGGAHGSEDQIRCFDACAPRPTHSFHALRGKAECIRWSLHAAGSAYRLLRPSSVGAAATQTLLRQSRWWSWLKREGPADEGPNKQQSGGDITRTAIRRSGIATACIYPTYGHSYGD